MGLPDGAGVKRSKRHGLIPGSGRAAGEGNGNLLSIFARRIPWTEELGGL